MLTVGSTAHGGPRSGRNVASRSGSLLGLVFGDLLLPCFLLLRDLCSADLLLLLPVLGDALRILRLLLLPLLPLPGLTAHHELPHVVFLFQGEELSDVRRALRAQAPGPLVIGQARNLLGALPDDDQGEGREVGTDDAAPHGLALALTSAALTEAAHALLEEQPNAMVAQDTLLHGEALLVVATRDAQDVALEFLSQAIARDFMTHALIEEREKLFILIDFDHLLQARRRVCDVELHGFCCCGTASCPMPAQSAVEAP